MKFNSVENYLASDKLVGAGRVDVFVETKDELGVGTMEAIKEKCPKATASNTRVLEVLSDGGARPVLTAEFIDMTLSE